jgi:hypothetical protein
MKKIIDCTTNEIIERELNKTEKDQQKIDAELVAQQKTELDAKEAARQTILEKLGLSADDLKTLLG